MCVCVCLYLHMFVYVCMWRAVLQSGIVAACAPYLFTFNVCIFLRSWRILSFFLQNYTICIFLFISNWKKYYFQNTGPMLENLVSSRMLLSVLYSCTFVYLYTYCIKLLWSLSLGLIQYTVSSYSLICVAHNKKLHTIVN